MAVLIFDYDGTLHDSMHIYEPAVRKCHEEMVKEGKVRDRKIHENEIRSYLGLSIKEMWLQFAPSLLEEERAEGGKIIGTYLRQSVEEGEALLFDGALDVLKDLKKKGHKIVYLSNCTESYMELHKKAFELDAYFDEMYCSEQFDWKEKYEIASLLMEKWKDEGLRSELIAIGDRYKDICMSQAKCPSGMGPLKTIWCAYGFGSETEGEDADITVSSVKDIPEAVDAICGSFQKGSGAI